MTADELREAADRLDRLSDAVNLPVHFMDPDQVIASSERVGSTRPARMVILSSGGAVVELCWHKPPADVVDRLAAIFAELDAQGWPHRERTER